MRAELIQYAKDKADQLDGCCMTTTANLIRELISALEESIKAQGPSGIPPLPFPGMEEGGR